MNTPPSEQPARRHRLQPGWLHRLTTPGGRTVTGVLAAGALALGSLVLLWPVLIAPIAADQRFMYAEAPGRTSGQWLRMFWIPIEQIPSRLHQGRFAPLAYIAQWISYTGVTELSITTSTDIVSMQALQKVVLLVLALLAVVAFAASLRGRTAAGALVRLGRRRLVLVAAATCLLGAAGTQAQEQGRNGWITYAVLTYGAVVVDFAVVALVLWLARRRVSAPSRRLDVLIVLVLAVVAVALNSSYELYYVAVPVAVLALILQPVAPAGQQRAERRAKLFVGGVLTVLFAAALVAVRAAIAASCANGGCYIGTQPSLGVGVLRTWLLNLGSSVPVFGRTEVLQQFQDVGLGAVPAWFASPLVVFVVLAAAGLLALRLVLGPAYRGPQAPAGGAGPLTATSRAVWTLGLQGALFSLCIALGSAALMSVSSQAQDVISTLGRPYRHTVVTWVALVLTGVMLVVALEARLRARQGVVLWGAVAVVAAVLGAAVLPLNLAATRAATIDPGTLAVSHVYDELVLGDTSSAGADRRCEVAHEAKAALKGTGPTAKRLLRGAYREYEYRYGQPYCASVKPTGAS
jgi:hypothetical protein